jgi:hypothetical protein
MTEIARDHSAGDNEEIVFECLTTQSRTNQLDSALSSIDSLDLSQKHSKVLLFRLKLTDWRGYLGRRQDSCGDLVQKRLKNMVIAPI